MTKLKTLLVIALLVGVVGAFPSATAYSFQASAPRSSDPVVDHQAVWAALTENPEDTVAFRVVIAPGELEGLEGVLEALRRAGSISKFAVAYGENAIYAEGSGSAVRFLATWPSVTDVSLTDEDDGSLESNLILQGTDAVLATGAVTGMVTAADGTGPLEGIRVRAYRQEDPTTWTLEATVYTTGDGSYEAIGLQPGFYRVRFEDPAGEYGWEYFDDKPSFSSADKFEIEDAETVAGIDAALARAGRIAGTVTALDGGEALADISVSAWYSTTEGWRSGASALSGSNGTFDLGGLPAGTYRLLFSDVYYYLYLDEVYDNLLYKEPYDQSLASGDPVAVTAGATTANIDAALDGYGTITGIVTSATTGDPISGIDVAVNAWGGSSAGWVAVGGDSTDVAGLYQVGALDTGDHRVQFTDPGGQYATEVYNDRTTLEAGDDVHVELGYETANIDAALELAPDTITYGLAQGWNLISFPVTLDDPTIEAALETIAGTYDVVWAYDGCASEWLKHDPDDPLDTLAAVDTMHGYWIDQMTAANLTVTGIHPVSTEISLCAGWNLIGYPSVTERPIEEVLAPIDGKYDFVYAYDASDPDDPWKTYNPNFPYGNDLTTMRAGYGYWVEMKEQATLTIPGR